MCGSVYSMEMCVVVCTGWRCMCVVVCTGWRCVCVCVVLMCVCGTGSVYSMEMCVW